MRKIFFNLIKKILQFLSWLWEQEGSPLQRAVGFGLGIFSGCFPFFGLQTLMGIFLARILKGNSLLAAVGTWISNPFTYVPLYFFNFRVGSILLNTSRDIHEFGYITKDSFWSQGWYFSSRILMGSTVVGLFFGLLGGLGLYFSLKKISNHNSQI